MSSRYRERFNDPAAARYSIPTYMWRSAPAGLATRRQLAALGLRPGGQDVAAQVMWAGRGGRDRVAYLYRIDAAAPKRPATPRQLAALRKADTARKTCPTCHEIRPYCISLRLGECNDCFDHYDAAEVA
jgi:hypothetical protein